MVPAPRQGVNARRAQITASQSLRRQTSPWSGNGARPANGRRAEAHQRLL